MKTLFLLALTFLLTSAYSNNPRGGSTTTTGTSRGTPSSEAAPVNDTVGTTQSSTMRESDMNIHSASDCVDRSGRVYTKIDTGYSSCKNKMRAK